MPQIAGNLENKYHSTHPIHELLMSNFLFAFRELLHFPKQPRTVAEIGTGEGELLKIIQAELPKSSLSACDISPDIIQVAKKNLKHANVRFSVQNAEKLSYPDNAFNLVVCCEVLEHIDHPEKALKELYRITKDHLLVSVPSEPIWRLLNIIRGKYWQALGNTPGHVNHWTAAKLIKLVEAANFEVILERHPFPWTMVLVKKLPKKR